MELALEDALLVAVGAEALGPVLDVERGTDAVALDRLAPEVGHVGGAGRHRGKSRRVIMFFDRGLDGEKRLGVEPLLAASGPDVAPGEPHLDRRGGPDLLN